MALRCLFKNLFLQELTTTEIPSAATAASAATTATTAVIAEFTTGAVETSAASACRAFFARTGFIDSQCTSVELFSVKSCDSGLCFRITAHGDECKAT